MAGVKVVFTPGWEIRVKAMSSDTVDHVDHLIASDARRASAVDTGEMRNSIDVDMAVLGEGRIRVGSDHWRFVEYGTRYMRAQPFMRPALYRNRGGS